MRFYLCILFLAVPIVAVCSNPKWRYQDAVIEQVGGSVCIKINDNLESREHPPEIELISIGGKYQDRHENLWRVSFVGRGAGVLVAEPDMCIPFESFMPFPKLDAGKAYTLELIGGVGNVSRFYSANFCMVEKGGVLEVHQVNFDRKRKVWAWDECDIPYRVP